MKKEIELVGVVVSELEVDGVLGFDEVFVEVAIVGAQVVLRVHQGFIHSHLDFVAEIVFVPGSVEILAQFLPVMVLHL